MFARPMNQTSGRKGNKISMN